MACGGYSTGKQSGNSGKFLKEIVTEKLVGGWLLFVLMTFKLELQ
jgi:hypothetical protein